MACTAPIRMDLPAEPELRRDVHGRATHHPREEPTAALVCRCLVGDPGAWEELVRAHTPRIYNLCYRFTGSPDDAHDLSQEIFLKIYRTLETYDHERGVFTAWITTMTRNLLVDHHRATRRERATDSLDVLPAPQEGFLPLSERLRDPDGGPERRMRQGDAHEMVHRALQKLSPELREAVVLRDLQDMDYRQIAEVLRVPEGTVKSRIHRGRTELARLVERTHGQVR